MAQDVRRRYQKTIRYQANAQWSEDLGRGMVLRDLYLRLQGQPTVTALNNTQAKTGRGDAWACITKIELIVNNQQVIRSLTGNELWWLNYFMYGTPPGITASIGDGSAANPAFDVSLVLPQWMFRSIRPMDTALDTRLLSDFKIRITWGDYTSVNSSATAWTVEPTLEVCSLESSNVTGPFSLQTVYSMSKVITADDSKFQVFLPLNDIYRGFLINTTDADVDSGAILNNIKIKSGTVVFDDISSGILQGIDNVLRKGGVRSFDGASGATGKYDSLQRSSSSNIAGWYWIDLVTDGMLSEAIDTLGFSEFYLECDVSVGVGTTRMSILPIQITPVRGAVK